MALGFKTSHGFQDKASATERDALGLTPEQNAALLESAARGRAQFEAGEGIPGVEVSRWLRSWGTENELPPPTRKARRA
jgi:predicted transcriptional regulator